jgi:hypothetical protein
MHEVTGPVRRSRCPGLTQRLGAGWWVLVRSLMRISPPLSSHASVPGRCRASSRRCMGDEHPSVAHVYVVARARRLRMQTTHQFHCYEEEQGARYFHPPPPVAGTASAVMPLARSERRLREAAAGDARWRRRLAWRGLSPVSKLARRLGFSLSVVRAEPTSSPPPPPPAVDASRSLSRRRRRRAAQIVVCGGGWSCLAVLRR